MFELSKEYKREALQQLHEDRRRPRKKRTEPLQRYSDDIMKAGEARGLGTDELYLVKLLPLYAPDMMERLRADGKTPEEDLWVLDVVE